MTPVGPRPKLLLLAIAAAATLGAMVLAAPDDPLELPALGENAVNTAPAIKVSLAGRRAPEPESEPESEPEPAPQPVAAPEPQPEPEPELPPEPEPEPEPEPLPEPEPEPESEPEPVTEPVAPPVDRPAQQISEPESGEEADDQDSQSAVALQNAGSSADLDSYLSKLSRHLSRYYEYPRRARRLGQEGTPVIVFEFARDGSLIDHSLRDSSGHQLLDDAALAMLADAAPLPEVPNDMRGQTFTYALPVRFSLR
ncbi:MAG: TonB family protein [Pseudomonadota bacterium]|nr:TonB family protein [Pseudomonadota bacterium]